MKFFILLSFFAVSLCGVCNAQSASLAHRGLPFIKESDQLKMQQQSASFYAAIEPLSKELGVHAVNVLSSGRMISRGTVTKAGIVTKWSEIDSRGASLSVVGFDGVRRKAVVKAVYLEYDLVLLECKEGLPAVDFSSAKTPDVGRFIFAVGPAKDSHGFGVVSVEPRSLRDQDKAYLGVRMGPVDGAKGVLVEWAEPKSAAAQAGLLRGDIVVKIDQMNIGGLHEMRSYLQKLSPGDTAVLTFIRGNKQFSVDVKLGATPQRRKAVSPRMQQMKRMGGSVNQVAEGFPDVLQSDMQVSAIDSGSPVFDLDGNFVGVIVARASRIKTYIITAEKLSEQLAKKPDLVVRDPGVSQAEIIPEPKRSPAIQAEIRRLKKVIEQAERRLLELQSE